ncbi:GNAT family N-acetyltransferase [Undibacterium sp.]|jgi:predicted GNAT family acetyltransferase|uniref:GNAT family N-acetyltransferase n=1 Tax=Undibacterium sp. TaxID=1914977 RepID=UPI002C8D01D1|nr:GNAT family N-acetyltransferase [Undibacterium sp.]HTD06776.1 GNAT family N-acetyltransferase [Undibacterium sp.]
MQITTDQSALDIPLIHRFLSEQSAWAKDIPLELVQRSIKHSLCFGAYLDGQQIAFARVVSDYSTFAYLVDVFVVPGQRRKGYSKQLVQAVLAHPDLQGLRRFMLASTDARGLYAQFGFKAPARPEILMEINKPNLYQQ